MALALRAETPLVVVAFSFLLPLAGCDRTGARAHVEDVVDPAADAEPVTGAAAAARRAARPPEPDPNAEARARAAAEQAALEAAYPMQGVVYHFLAQVFAAPSNLSPIVGYMRRGAKFRAAPRESGPGCSQGWYRIPGDGYVCKGRGYQIGTTPQTFEPSPAPAALSEALPYAYARTARDHIPQYWKVPTHAEERTADNIVAEIAAREEAAADGGVPAAPAEVPAEPELASDVEAPPPPGQVADVGAVTSAATQRNVLGVELPDFLRMRMLKGFFVSVDGVEELDGRRFVRTVRGGYVREDALIEAQPPSMRGVVLGGDWHLPLAFVFRGGARLMHRDESGALHDAGVVDRFTPMVVAQDDLTRSGRRYVLGTNGMVVREPAVQFLRPVPRPPRVPGQAKWIHVDLEHQTLVAYEGDTPVFATLVSSGKEGFETPTGLFQIMSKHVSTTMDDEQTVDGAYSIEDVPWTMYFHGNIALHGAFWHSSFGQTRSHGCVNLAPADARWLFQWTTPRLPAAWHGVFADARRGAGTWVWVTGPAPAVDD